MEYVGLHLWSKLSLSIWCPSCSFARKTLEGVYFLLLVLRLNVGLHFWNLSFCCCCRFAAVGLSESSILCGVPQRLQRWMSGWW